MKLLDSRRLTSRKVSFYVSQGMVRLHIRISSMVQPIREKMAVKNSGDSERGDVPGWVLVVLMTTGLVTAIWTIAAPRLTAILRNSLDSMNGIR